MGVIGRAGGGTEQAALVLRKFGHLYVSPARHVVLTVTRTARDAPDGES